MPMIGISVQKFEELQLSLQAAIELLSSYAKQLNKQDGGTRKTYKTIDEWMKDARP